MGLHAEKWRDFHNPMSWDVRRWERSPYYWTFCEGNPPVAGGFPSQRVSNMDLWCFFGVGINKLFKKQPGNQWSETPWYLCVITVKCPIVKGRLIVLCRRTDVFMPQTNICVYLHTKYGTRLGELETTTTKVYLHCKSVQSITYWMCWHLSKCYIRIQRRCGNSHKIYGYTLKLNTDTNISIFIAYFRLFFVQIHAPIIFLHVLTPLSSICEYVAH